MNASATGERRSSRWARSVLARLTARRALLDAQPPPLRVRRTEALMLADYALGQCPTEGEAATARRVLERSSAARAWMELAAPARLRDVTPIRRRDELRPIVRARWLAPALLVFGLLLVAELSATLLWKEPLSALYAARGQASLASELERVERAGAAPRVRSGPERGAALAAAARRHRDRLDGGDAVGRLRIPDLDLNLVVAQGSEGASLRRGPGHYDRTPLPGQSGTVGIAGHRTTYGAPFRHLDSLERGDRLTLKMPYGRFTYEVSGSRIVPAERLGVFSSRGRQRLVLTACHPLFSAAERIVVTAPLVRAETL